MTPSHQRCVVENKEGKFHRTGGSGKQPLINEDNTTKQVIEKLRSSVLKCVGKGRCVTSGSAWRL